MTMRMITYLAGVFETSLTNTATNTTLGTATRYTPASVTVDLPWTTRTIKHAEVRAGARDVFGTIVDIDGFRCGLKINAVATSDGDYTVTPVNTGDHTRFRGRRNGTTYMATNDPGTATFTLELSFAMATGSASNIVGITGQVWLTVEFDDTTGSGVGVKTAGFPIQSHHTLHSTSYVEVGTVSGTSNAPAFQIQQLTGSGDPALPEASVSVKHNYIQVLGLELGTTSRTHTYRADGATDNARFACDQTNATTVDYEDWWNLKTAGAAGIAITTTAAHAFEVKVDQANKAESFGGVHWVTYTYDTTSPTHLVSLILPLMNGGSNQLGIADSTATDTERLQMLVDIQEPSAIVMRQSGVVLHSLHNSITKNINSSGQTTRTYTVASDATRNNGPTLVHRGDHSLSTWGLSRGINRLTVEVGATTEAITTLHLGGFGLLNYHCGLSGNGFGAHNHSCLWNVTDYLEVAAATRTNISPAAPSIPEAVYSIQGVLLESETWIATLQYAVAAAERGANEGAGAGWQQSLIGFPANSAAELGSKRIGQDITDWWVRKTGVPDPESLNIETARSWQIWSPGAAWQGAASMWVTYHANTFTVSGSYEIDGDAQISEADIVDVFAVDDIFGTGELVAADLDTDGAGEFSCSVTDDTRLHYAVGRDTSPGASGRGHPQGLPNTPSVRSRGVAVSGTGAVVPAWPNHRKHDIAILICESNSGEAVSLTDAHGFAALADSPQNATGTRLSVFWCRATGDAMTAPTVGDPGDHVVAQIIVIKGCERSGDPWDVTSGDTAATSTSVVVPGDTTTVANCLVIAITTSGEDSATAQSSAWANADLAGFREYLATQVTDGGGGGFYCAAGVKKTAGAYTTSSATLANTSTQARLSIALKGHDPSAGVFDIAAYSTPPPSSGSGGAFYSRAMVVNAC